MLSTLPYKGTRDFYPEDKRLQKVVFNQMRKVVESYGYEEYDAPIIESVDLYKAKSGEEIVNEQTYSFEDRSGRKITIRPEMTPSVNRMVAARRQELPYPLRWYSIPNLCRYERPQRGRLREHWQLNVDIFGIDNINAELELIQLSDSILKSFGATPEQYSIKLNSRGFIDYLFKDYFGLSEEFALRTIKLVDRMHKLEASKFEVSIREVINDARLGSVVADEMLTILKTKNIDYLPLPIRSHESLEGVMSLMNSLDKIGLNNYVFDITLMRGFDYYTDIVFEIFDNSPENNRAMMGGGRYNGLVGLFGVDPISTAGFGLGDVTLLDFLEVHKLLPKTQPETNVYVSIIGNHFMAANKIIDEMRQKGINVAVDMTSRKLSTQIKTAEKKKIPFILFIGEDEISSGKLVLRNIETRNESTYTLNQAVKAIEMHLDQ